jgi:hypothetical protein
VIGSALRALVCAVLIVIAYWNILRFHENSVENLSIRAQNLVVIEEQRISTIRTKLIELGYTSGKIAFVTADDLVGKPRTAEADLTWSIDRYAMIPWLLVRDTLDTPYAMADFSGAEPAAEVGAGFRKIYDPGNGLVLFQKTQ